MPKQTLYRVRVGKEKPTFYELKAASEEEARAYVERQEMRLWMDATDPSVDVVTGRENLDGPLKVESVDEA